MTRYLWIVKKYVAGWYIWLQSKAKKILLPCSLHTLILQDQLFFVNVSKHIHPNKLCRLIVIINTCFTLRVKEITKNWLWIRGLQPEKVEKHYSRGSEERVSLYGFISRVSQHDWWLCFSGWLHSMRTRGNAEALLLLSLLCLYL